MHMVLHCVIEFYLYTEFSFLMRYYNLLYQSLIPNCKLSINALRQHISISDNIEQYIVSASSPRTSCQRLLNFLLIHLYSEKDYMQFCYHINIISVMTDLPYRLITGRFKCRSLATYMICFILATSCNWLYITSKCTYLIV